jgi:transmembrane sensor
VARDDTNQDAIREEAARWFTRLQATPLPLEDTVEWQRWMALDSRHGEAFRALEEVWLRFASVPRPALLPAEELSRDRYDESVPISVWNASLARTRRRRTVGLALAASLVVSLVGLVTLWAQHSASGDSFATRVGENRSVLLVDGSRLSLGGETRVTVRFDRHTREIQLHRGEALFNVAKDPSRPFRVVAGTASVTAVGTEFNVRRNADRVVVSVLEGRVLVQPVQPAVPLPWIEEVVPVVSHGEKRPLDAGRRATVDQAGVDTVTPVANASVVTAWRSGQLSFDNEPLRYAVEAVNRYSTKRIVIGDPRIEDIRVSGTAVQDHIEGWVASLQTAFGIHAVEDAAGIRLESGTRP